MLPEPKGNLTTLGESDRSESDIFLPFAQWPHEALAFGGSDIILGP